MNRGRSVDRFGPVHLFLFQRPSDATSSAGIACPPSTHTSLRSAWWWTGKQHGFSANATACGKALKSSVACRDSVPHRCTPRINTGPSAAVRRRAPMRRRFPPFFRFWHDRNSGIGHPGSTR